MTTHAKQRRGELGRAGLRTAGATIVMLVGLVAPSAQAAPTHQPLGAVVEGLDHACGTAVDSQGDLYASSAGEAKVEIFDPSHSRIGTLEAGLVEPCALAVDGDGNLYVSDSGQVFRYRPSEYPFSGTPSYEAPEAIDTSGNAKGIAVDPYDNRLYVAEGTCIAVYEASGSLEAAIESEDEVQRVVVREASGGSFKLSFEGHQSAAIPFEATAAELKGALEGIAALTGNVEVTKPAAGEYAITFSGALADTDVAEFVPDYAALASAGDQSVAVSERSKGRAIAEASGVAVYTHVASENRSGAGELWEAKLERYIAIADAAGGEADRLEVLGGQAFYKYNATPKTTFSTPKLRRRIESLAGHQLQFGPAGAYLAADPGNEGENGGCDRVGKQACTAGHFFLYDHGQNQVEELEATGRFLDAFTAPALEDGDASQVAVDRSGGPGDGTVYVSSGASAGAKVLAFGPLGRPGRPLEQQLSERLNEGERLKRAESVATDRFGDVYVGTGPEVHVFSPDGAQITSFADPHKPGDLAVDSTGKVYVLDLESNIASESKVTYYTSSSFPPSTATTYSRHESPLAVAEDVQPLTSGISAIAVDPANDHVFVTGGASTLELDSAARGSRVLDRCFACGLDIGYRGSIGVEGATGEVYFGAATRQITVVDASGEEALARFDGGGCPGGPVGARPSIAVEEASGHAVEFQPADEGAREYEASGACVAEFGQATALSRGYRLAVDNACALHRNAAGEAEPLDSTTTPTCAQFDPSNGDVYVAYDDTAPGSFDLTAYGPLSYGEAPRVSTAAASDLSGGGATLNGTVSPGGMPLTKCAFQYLTEAEYIAAGESFAGAAEAPCAEPDAAEVGEGTSPVAVHAEVEGLAPEGRYRFRLVAENELGSGAGEPRLFGPPQVLEAQSALPVLYDEATLRARFESAGLPTTYRFQYVTQAHFEAEGFEGAMETESAQLAAGEGGVAVQLPAVGLAEGTAYRFRAVVANEAGTAIGPDLGFTTLQREGAGECPNSEYRTGLSAGLPQCRAYELVTPLDTKGLVPYAGEDGGSNLSFNNWLVDPRGEGAGGRVTFFTSGTIPGFQGNGLLDGYTATRGAGEHPAGGWQSSLVGPTYREAVPDFTAQQTDHPQGVAADQLYSLWKIDPAELLEGTLPKAIYLRLPSGGADPACNPQPAQSDFELVGCGDLGTDTAALSRYVSSGGSHLLFTSSVPLEPSAPPAGTEAIYDRAAGSPHASVVSAKPGGGAFAAGEDAAYIGASEDGSAVVFKVGGALYLHREGRTSEVAAGPSSFAGISGGGRLLFYSDAADGSAPGTLHVFDAEAGISSTIADEAVFVNVSADGSRAYYSAEEGGVPKLFAWDAASQTSALVSDLDPADFEGFGGLPLSRLDAWTRALTAGFSIGRAYSPTRSTADGGTFVFQSHAALTGYGNQGRGEIYRYDAGAAAGERLLCVSCDPSGAAPSADAVLEDLTAPNALQSTTEIANLTEDGQEVFFQSRDRLLPEDANEAEDVYEWRALGAGGCRRPGGCLALISSGQGEAPSVLYGMSADGHDVVFRTPERLLGSDAADGPSLYDARVEGGIPEAVAPSPCQGDACQGEGNQPPVLPAPTSGGAGSAAHRPGCPRGRRAARRHSHRRCRHARHHHRHHRHAGGRRGRGGSR